MRSKGDHSRLVANPAWRIGIVHSAFYPEEVGGLIEGAMSVLREAGIPEENITLHSAPGCFEIPLIGAALASKNPWTDSLHSA